MNRFSGCLPWAARRCHPFPSSSVAEPSTALDFGLCHKPGTKADATDTCLWTADDDTARCGLGQLDPVKGASSEKATSASQHRRPYWVCRSLDGNHQLLRGIPYWSISPWPLEGGVVLAILDVPPSGNGIVAIGARGLGAPANACCGPPADPLDRLRPRSAAVSIASLQQLPDRCFPHRFALLGCAQPSIGQRGHGQTVAASVRPPRRSGYAAAWLCSPMAALALVAEQSEPLQLLKLSRTVISCAGGQGQPP